MCGSLAVGAKVDLRRLSQRSASRHIDKMTGQLPNSRYSDRVGKVSGVPVGPSARGVKGGLLGKRNKLNGKC